MPIRTCISCGVKRSKKELIRVILSPQGFAVKAIHGNKGGRGAYVCPEFSCCEGLNNKQLLKKAFKKHNDL